MCLLACTQGCCVCPQEVTASKSRTLRRLAATPPPWWNQALGHRSAGSHSHEPGRKSPSRQPRAPRGSDILTTWGRKPREFSSTHSPQPDAVRGEREGRAVRGGAHTVQRRAAAQHQGKCVAGWMGSGGQGSSVRVVPANLWGGGGADGCRQDSLKLLLW